MTKPKPLQLQKMALYAPTFFHPSAHIYAEAHFLYGRAILIPRGQIKQHISPEIYIRLTENTNISSHSNPPWKDLGKSRRRQIPSAKLRPHRTY